MKTWKLVYVKVLKSLIDFSKKKNLSLNNLKFVKTKRSTSKLNFKVFMFVANYCVEILKKYIQ